MFLCASLEIQKIVPFNLASRLKGLASTVSDWKVVVMAETAAAAPAVVQVAASQEATTDAVVVVDGAEAPTGEAAEAAVETIEASAEALAPAEDAIPASQPRTPEVATCRRCQQEIQVKDAICTAKFRLELRYTCHPCHAVLSQLQRRGVDIKEVLTEAAAVTFFQDAKNERANGMEGRLCYAQSRALLVQKMV